MTRTLTAAGSTPAAIGRDLERLRRTYMSYGWTIWHGESTGQYWAAHTRSMVLLYGDTTTDLATAINRFERAAQRPHIPPQRRTSTYSVSGRADR